MAGRLVSGLKPTWPRVGQDGSLTAWRRWARMAFSAPARTQGEQTNPNTAQGTAVLNENSSLSASISVRRQRPGRITADPVFGLNGQRHSERDTKASLDQTDGPDFVKIMPSIPFLSHGREKPVFLVLLSSSYIVLSVIAVDPTGSLPLPTFNIGNGLINIAALTALVGSSTVESLVLGNRGASGLPWAALSIFGSLSVLKACVTGASPGWLRETIGARNGLSDSILGMSLDLVQNLRGESKARRNVGEAIGIVCKKQASEAPGSAEALGQARTTWQDTYAFDRSTSKLLNSIPESNAGGPLTIFTYRNYPFDRPTNISQEWMALSVSFLKGIELYTLWMTGDRALCWVSGFPWLYFYIAAVALQLRRHWRGQPEDSGSDWVDILAGRLPTTTRPGGSRKLLLGTSENSRLFSAWRIVWAFGAIVCIVSVIGTYVLLGRAAHTTFYVWSAFQMAWLILSLMFYHFSDATDPMAYRLLLAQAPWKDLTMPMKERVLTLALALAKYQMHFHPRGIYCYDEDLLSARTLCGYLSTVGHHLQTKYPLDLSAKSGDIIDISVHAVVGDPTLASTAWIRGYSYTGMDLYDCCLLFLNVQGSLIAIPAARVLSDPLTSKLDVESSIVDSDIINKGSTNTGQGITWWYWIPCGEGSWLQTCTDDMRFLGKRKAEVLSDAQVTQKLSQGRLIVSLKSVQDVRDVVSVSTQACQILVDIMK